MTYTQGNPMLPTESKRKRSKFVAHLMSTLGGANAGVHAAFADYVHRSAYDNANELENLSDVYREHAVQTFPLALCETIESMYQGSDSSVAELLPSIANSNSRNGLSARARFGGQAGYLLASSKDHQNRLVAMRNMATIEKRGQIHAIVHDFLIGLSGGTAPGAIISLLEAYERLYSSLGIPVEIRIHAVGFFGLIGASESGPLNDPCARAAIIAYVTSKAPPMIVRSLRLFDQPPLGPTAIVERTRFNILYYQAIQSEDVRKHFELVESNDSTTSTLGNISLRDIGIVQSPPSIVALRANAASQMLTKFEHVAAMPNANPSILENETWLNRTIRMRNINFDELLHKHWMNASLLVQEATTRIEESDPSIVVDVPGLGRIDVSSIDHVMGTPLESEGDLKLRQVLLVTLNHLLRLRVQELERQHPALLAASAKWTKKVRALVASALKARKITIRQKLLAQIRKILSEIRKISDAIFLIEDRLRKLRIAQGLTAEAQSDLDEALKAVKDSLNECIFALGPQSRGGLVATPRVSEALKDLLALPTLPLEQRVSRLDRFAPVITKQGLKEILQAKHASIESIADVVVFGEPTYSSPPLGGQPYNYGGPTIYVLPNIEKEDAILIEKAILSRDVTALVAFVETNNCGAAVVKIKVRNFDTVRSLFPGELEHNLVRALGSEHAELRFPSSMDCLKHLGIRFCHETGTILFEKERPIRN